MLHEVPGTDLVALTLSPDRWVALLGAIAILFALCCSFAHYCGQHSKD